MHVPQLLEALLIEIDVKVVETSLPEMAVLNRETFFPEPRLMVSWFSCRFEQTFGNGLLETLKDSRGISFIAFCDQDMKVLRHHDVAHNFELVFAPDLLEDAKKDIAGMLRTQQRPLLAESTLANTR